MPVTMKMIAEYLEHALQFERLANEEKNLKFREELLKQAKDYRQLADERARSLDIAAPH